MYKYFGLAILMLSLLAIGHAAMVYKRSTYFETTSRVNLNEVIANIEQMEQQRLVELTRRVAKMSNSDYQVLNILSEEFRAAIVYLVICLLSALALIVLQLFKLWRRQQQDMNVTET